MCRWEICICTRTRAPRTACACSTTRAICTSGCRAPGGSASRGTASRSSTQPSQMRRLQLGLRLREARGQPGRDHLSPGGKPRALPACSAHAARCRPTPLPSMKQGCASSSPSSSSTLRCIDAFRVRSAASARRVFAQRGSLLIHGERIETYLVTYRQSGQTFLEAQVSQLGQVLQVKTASATPSPRRTSRHEPVPRRERPSRLFREPRPILPARDPRHNSRQTLRRAPRRRWHRPRHRAGRILRLPRARTPRARRPPSRCSPACCGRPPARCEIGGFDMQARARPRQGAARLRARFPFLYEKLTSDRIHAVRRRSLRARSAADRRAPRGRSSSAFTSRITPTS